MGEQQREVVIITKCPALARYKTEDLQKMARELIELQRKDPNAVTPKAIRDYRAVRDRCAALVRQKTK